MTKMKMKINPTVSKPTISRMPRYYRVIKELSDNGEKMVSSSQLSEIMGFTPEQIRKDFSDFGQFGIKGVGYSLETLMKSIENILGLQYHWNMAIVGIGRLGTALANYKNFQSMGFTVQALFDIDEKLIGQKINGVKVYDFAKINEVIKRKIIDIGVIAVPDTQAQAVADTLIKSGVKGIWNFAPKKIQVPPEIHLVNEDIALGLTLLSYHLSRE